MDSFTRSSSGFRYNPDSNTMSEGEIDSEESAVLEIYVHHARNIHNICIYDNQDVYAKFSLTYNPDEIHSTRVSNGGGKNPEFNEKLVIKVTQLDSVLKCEMWMLSRDRNYLEDQLLGFALVPISQIIGKGKVTQEYSLSSTDLFHSPAGTVKLTLFLDSSSLPLNLIPSSNSSSISNEVVLLDPVQYSRIEFPDINVVTENQRMVSEVFDGLRLLGSSNPASFLRLGSSTTPPLDASPPPTKIPYVAIDYSMYAISPPEENLRDSDSPNLSNQNSSFLSSTTTSLSDDSNEKKVVVLSNVEPNQSSSICPDTPTSKKDSDERESKEGNKKESRNSVFSSPLGNINIETEQSAMQQQIVDMYMRSMQQFTESLAKMKLPMDLDKPETEDHSSKLESDKNKKDGSRVFYGSRAFF